jgi:hypothetical protein
MSQTDAHISLLPYIRQGLSGSFTSQDNLGNGVSTIQERGEINLQYDLVATPVSGADVTFSQTQAVEIYGPGDIVGISNQAISKVCPQDWETNFESNYIPFIEFYDHDFPWRYTPASANVNPNDTGATKLRPWLTLVVLTEDEFELDALFSGVLPSFSLKPSALVSEVMPDEKQTWAWAHIQVNADLGEKQNVSVNNALATLNNIIGQTPDKVFSRLMCGRRLRENTSYRAFLIPTFETGRLAGLNLAAQIMASSDALAPAWSRTAPNSPRQFPYYHSWYFKTGKGGDFESLARLLKPMAVPAEVGKRKMDIQWPGDNQHLDLRSPVPVLELEGIVKTPGQVSDTWTIPDTGNGLINGLVTVLNRPSEVLANGSADPLISAPLYGAWHAKKHSISTITDDWFHRINLDPRYRVFAGLGTEVVRKHQDEFMEIAWKQVGDILAANRALSGLQLAQEISLKLYRRNIKNQPQELVLTLTGNTHSRIMVPNVSPASTVHKQIKQSAVPVSVFSAAFRRISSPRGVFARMVDNTTSQAFTQFTFIQNLNSTISGAFSYTAPVGQMSLTALTPSQLTASYTLNQAARANFSFSNPGPSAPTVTSTGSDSVQAANFRSAAASFHTMIQAQPLAPSPADPLDIPATATVVQNALEPVALFNALASQITQTTPNGNTTPRNTTDTVMAAPSIRKAMYSYLIGQSPDWMIPNLNALRQNSVTMFEVNQQAIEAYMLGLNHEFGRELLWRGYPTDQRGTYFSHFWDFANSTKNTTQPNDYSPLRDIKPVHTWVAGNNFTALGTNSARTVPTGNLLIVAIRGDLLRMYPTTSISMQKAKWHLNNANNPVYTVPRELDYSQPSFSKHPMFSAKAEPDILFFGFDISEAAARGVDEDPNQPGWFFVLKERAGDIRFGLDEFSGQVAIPNVLFGGWGNLEWGHFIPSLQQLYPYIDVENGVFLNQENLITNPDTISWGYNSADIGYALVQDPIRLALHAKDLLPSITN